jgi:hypothetical protein
MFCLLGAVSRDFPLEQSRSLGVVYHNDVEGRITTEYSVLVLILRCTVCKYRAFGRC